MKTNLGSIDPSPFSLTSVNSVRRSGLGWVVFRDSFNHFEKINATQAWSLLFTGGRGDRAFGTRPVVGLFYNLLSIAIVLLGVFWNLSFPIL